MILNKEMEFDLLNTDEWQKNTKDIKGDATLVTRKGDRGSLFQKV